MFNPAETGLLGPYISRKMRRRAERMKPLEERAPKNTMGNFLMSVRETMPKAKVSQDGYRGGARILFDLQREGKRMIASFRHPTKPATSGRMCFVTVTS